MRILVWQWGRRGAGPRFAMHLAQGLAALPETESILSLAADAELLGADDAPACAWRQKTYRSAAGYALARAASRWRRRQVARPLRDAAPDIAVCAMPALLDIQMIAALRIPYAVIVHDASAHPGERWRFRLLNQRASLRGAALIVALTESVAGRLRDAGYGTGGQRLLTLRHPPMPVGMPPADLPAPFAHGGRPRLLMFGRLLPYKGLDLLDAAMTRLGPDPGFALKIAGDGPASPALQRLAAHPAVTVDRRWIPETELNALLAGADAVVLPYREASQSGIAAAALALGRPVLATDVGGLGDQLRGETLARLCRPEPAALAAALAGLVASPPAAPPSDSAGAWRRMAAELRAGLAAVVQRGPDAAHARPASAKAEVSQSGSDRAAPAPRRAN